MIAISTQACSSSTTAASPPSGELPATEGRVWIVGPARLLTTPSAAARAAGDGDVIEIDAALYPGDVAVWRQSHLTIRGVGGRPHLRADGANAEGKAIWVTKGNEITIENVEFSGARVDEGNGAGIRSEGAGLTLRGCSFHDNQNGILAGANPQSEIVIERCEFAANGNGDGLTHNIYVGDVRRLRVDHTYSHHAVAGHNIKTRARETILNACRFADEDDGRASYAVDAPNGGKVSLTGNVIQQGPAAENSTLVSYGVEGLYAAGNELRVTNNTFVNDRPGGGVFLAVADGAPAARVEGNVFAGPGTVAKGPVSLGQNRIERDFGTVDRNHAPDGAAAGIPGAWP